MIRIHGSTNHSLNWFVFNFQRTTWNTHYIYHFSNLKHSWTTCCTNHLFTPTISGHLPGVSWNLKRHAQSYGPPGLCEHVDKPLEFLPRKDAWMVRGDDSWGKCAIYRVTGNWLSWWQSISMRKPRSSTIVMPMSPCFFCISNFMFFVCSLYIGSSLFVNVFRRV